jgi:hypothetical protein
MFTEGQKYKQLQFLLDFFCCKIPDFPEGSENVCVFTKYYLPSQTPVAKTHCKENPIYVFLFWELGGLSPNFHIHVSAHRHMN